MATLTGSNGSDALHGADAADESRPVGGHDSPWGLGSDDNANGGIRIDRIDWGRGGDALRGEVRVERPFGGREAKAFVHHLCGSEGNDLSWGGAGVCGLTSGNPPGVGLVIELRLGEIGRNSMPGMSSSFFRTSSSARHRFFRLTSGVAAGPSPVSAFPTIRASNHGAIAKAASALTPCRFRAVAVALALALTIGGCGAVTVPAPVPAEVTWLRGPHRAAVSGDSAEEQVPMALAPGEAVAVAGFATVTGWPYGGPGDEGRGEDGTWGPDTFEEYLREAMPEVSVMAWSKVRNAAFPLLEPGWGADDSWRNVLARPELRTVLSRQHLRYLIVYRLRSDEGDVVPLGLAFVGHFSSWMETVLFDLVAVRRIQPACVLATKGASFALLPLPIGVGVKQSTERAAFAATAECLASILRGQPVLERDQSPTTAGHGAGGR